LVPGKIDTLKQIADRLADNGIATLRFDKRAVATYKDKWPKTSAEMNRFFSWRSFVEDAEGALTALRSRPDVDPTRVGLLGHSEGALITLQMAAELNQPPTAIVLIGSTGRKMGGVLRDQISAGLAKSPTIDPKPYMDYVDAANSALEAGKPLPPNAPTGLAGLYNPVFLDLLTNYCQLDPCELAKHYAGPVLVVNGQDDTQVLAEKDTPRLAAALKSRSNATVRVFIVKKASHNLKSTADGNNDAMFGPIVPMALDTITDWLSTELAKRNKS
jgi:pimeloyl-ACP methyl ester carboxylesterase